jgi:cell division protein FtsB
MNRASPPPAAVAFRRHLLRTVYWFLAVSVLFNLVFGEMGLIQGFRQRSKANHLEREVESLQANNTTLMTEIDDLLHNPYRIETIARQELGLCRPGEIIFLFPDGETHDGAPF